MTNLLLNFLCGCWIILTGFITCFAPLLKCIEVGRGENASSILFVILSQSNDYHVKEAEKFRHHFNSQLDNLDKSSWPQVLFTHEHFLDIPGTWTIFPLIDQLVHLHTGWSWVFICEEDTRVDINALARLLQSKNASKHHFLGRELRDHETTIIHHFAFSDNPLQFAYPDFRAGFVLSISLVKHLHNRLNNEKLKIEFSIDPKHEFALFVWDEGRGTPLVGVKEFCSVDQSYSSGCITRQLFKFPDCNEAIKEEDLFVAVKTCEKFHNTRIPIVKATWGKETKYIEYFSEIEDRSIPTTKLDVPNTERGHCSKTMAIIKRIIESQNLSSIPWVLIADDDTIINLSRLRSLLACYNAQQPVALGERYGYGLIRGGGYDYITGGGGMVFSQPVLKFLSLSCRCYTEDSPDDMTLGICLKAGHVPVTHSRFFHQARPDDYSREFLSNQLSVSFHKHWNNDPYKVYTSLTSSSSAMKENGVKLKHTSKVEL
ncbi:beta-1 3-glucosyltransferase [Biomphalaria glabrata]|nr:beta-1; 3-glucosyltransferase-like [Biomphalaria glabrata]